MGMGLAVLSAASKDPQAKDPSKVSYVHAYIARHPGRVWAGALVFFLAASFIFRGYSGIVELPGTYGQQSWVNYLGDWWVGLAVALLWVLPALFGDSAGGWVRGVLANRTLTWLGVISYGAYLWHFAIQNELQTSVSFFAELPPGASTIAMVAVGGVVSVVAGALSYYGVELYFLRRKEPRRDRRAGSAAATAVASAKERG
jgi:peptidoglycan/LPS O-acetylase OafA/YrhL